MNFKALHQEASPLLIGNVWDASSAKIAGQSGFKALGTSSAAMASMLGYADGQNLSFEELCYLVRRIRESTSLPLSVDLENGYGDTVEQVASNILALENLGVTGINLEDSTVGEERELLDAREFAGQLAQVKQLLKEADSQVFLNIRTDTFLLGIENKLAETKARIVLYESAGADGIFVPCITQPADIEELTSSTQLPLNVMCMPGLPNFQKLRELGVRRISMGNFAFDYLARQLEQIYQTIQTDQSFKPIL